MKYSNIIKGQFVSRPNRFIANIKINGHIEVCHVKNTGRCKELLIPCATVYVCKSNNPERKTKYDLIAVEKGSRIINMDSQIPNKVFAEFAPKLFKNITLLHPETKYKNSRFDFYIEADGKKIFTEVKGVTLEKDGVAMFPDAPTERGIKHINELIDAVENGYTAYIAFIIQMKGIKHFCPNEETHPEFAIALKKAKEKGVNIIAVDCNVTPDTIIADEFVEIKV